MDGSAERKIFKYNEEPDPESAQDQKDVQNEKEKKGKYSPENDDFKPNDEIHNQNARLDELFGSIR